MTTQPTRREQQRAYRFAYRILARLERPNPGSGEQLQKHLYNADGDLLETLGEVIQAAEQGELMTCPVRPEWLGEM